MPANLNDVGIQSSSLSLLEGVDYSQKVEEALIMDSDSSFGDAEAFNPIVEFSFKGRGSIPANLAIGSDGGGDAAITDVSDGGSGVIILTNVKRSESNTDFDSWEVSGTYYPNAA